ncbi:hypothetical protein DFP72DRAFT_873252 [Ephemerocybe angulata]|uniref:Alba domain-containing protein n=1 Tax=Ephemerocybe angulata TaxID=980116 RepID=A0A8H6IDS7_9AGAR|nr:hypothetical protein DFP72DRAFT_873252 [Tulosesus angulatus]
MAQSQPDVHSIRITSQGKIKNWVSFALNSFQENPDLPLAFHTISPKVSKGKKDAKKLASSAALVPRLLTVVEIVKREYLRDLATRRSPRMKGLHQYNEIGTLEDTEDTKEEKAEGGADEEQERAKKIVEAVSGKNHVRQTQTPFMRVTLSTCELPHLEAAGATYQPPTTRKLSKSAKARAAKRRRREEGEEAAERGTAEQAQGSADSNAEEHEDGDRMVES